MQNLTIATFNPKNKFTMGLKNAKEYDEKAKAYKNVRIYDAKAETYKNVKIYDRDAEVLVDFINYSGIDHMGLQEATPLLIRKIGEFIDAKERDYEIRSLSKGTKNPFTNVANEYNAIISNLKPSSDMIEKHLMSGSIFRLGTNYRQRKLIEQHYELKDGSKIITLNTHLTPDNFSKTVNNNQLNEIGLHINGLRNTEPTSSIILTGLLNLMPDTENFKKFEELLAVSNMKIAIPKGRTYNPHTDNLPVSYVAYSSDFTVNSTGIANLGISLHKPFVVELEKKLKY